MSVSMSSGSEERMPCGHPLSSLAYRCGVCHPLDARPAALPDAGGVAAWGRERDDGAGLTGNFTKNAVEADRWRSEGWIVVPLFRSPLDGAREAVADVTLRWLRAAMLENSDGEHPITQYIKRIDSALARGEGE